LKDSSKPWVDFKFPNYDPHTDADRYELDQTAGQRAIDFFSECITHIKGELAGKPFNLELWQQSFIGHLFGWKKSDGTRRYSEVYYSTGRKNGKTSIAAGLAIYTLLCDNELGCEVYLAAGDRNQAGICYDIMAQMIARSPELQKRCQVYRNHVRTPDGFCKVISADAPTKLGFNSHCVILDELISQPKRDLVDVLITSTAARRQPLVVYLTTAGWDRQSICYEKYEYAKGVCKGTIRNSTFFPVVYEVEDQDANYFSPETWKLANPNLGTSISEEWLARNSDMASETPAFENTFRTLHLNQWCEAENRFFPMADFDECPTMIDMDTLEGEECYIGCDMASKEDVAALCAVFPPTPGRKDYVVLGKYFIPRSTMFERVRKHNVSYDQWAKQGRVITTPGPTIEPERIFEQVAEWWNLYDVKEFVYDPHGAEWIVAKVENTYGEEITVMISGAVTKISGPIMTMYEKIRQRRINFGGCPVLRWMTANTTVEFSKDGLVKPIKPQSHLKIDGVIATAIALSRAVLSEFDMEEEFISKYESDDMVMLFPDKEDQDEVYLSDDDFMNEIY